MQGLERRSIAIIAGSNAAATAVTPFLRTGIPTVTQLIAN